MQTSESWSGWESRRGTESWPGSESWRELWLDLLALLWPTRCVSCGARDRDCCADCRAELRAGRGEWRRVLTPAGVAACAAGPYAGPLRALLVACKHGGRTGFATELGARLRAPLREALSLARGPAPPVIVTAPSSPARLRERGYRHVDLIVRAALRGWPRRRGRPIVIRGALRARPGRRSQVGLGASARQANAALVEVRPRARAVLRGREVILVDDIVTTGATVAAAVGAIEAAGASVVEVVALCVVGRRDATESRSRLMPERAPERVPGDAPERRSLSIAADFARRVERSGAKTIVFD